MDRIPSVSVSEETVSFNGATTFQPWIVNYVFYERSTDRFNGATTFQPWIVLNAPVETVGPQVEKFQWGHDFSAMDRAAIFRPLLLPKKWRFARGSSTSYQLPES